MEYANDEIYNIRYNERKDCLEEGKRGFIRRHKVMSVVIVSTAVLIGINGMLIFEFVSILANGQ